MQAALSNISSNNLIHYEGWSLSQLNSKFNLDQPLLNENRWQKLPENEKQERLDKIKEIANKFAKHASLPLRDYKVIVNEDDAISIDVKNGMIYVKNDWMASFKNINEMSQLGQDWYQFIHSLPCSEEGIKQNILELEKKNPAQFKIILRFSVAYCLTHTISFEELSSALAHEIGHDIYAKQHPWLKWVRNVIFNNTSLRIINITPFLVSLFLENRFSTLTALSGPVMCILALFVRAKMQRDEERSADESVKTKFSEYAEFSLLTFKREILAKHLINMVSNNETDSAHRVCFQIINIAKKISKFFTSSHPDVAERLAAFRRS